jgi:hypothetical protein
MREIQTEIKISNHSAQTAIVRKQSKKPGWEGRGGRWSSVGSAIGCLASIGSIDAEYFCSRLSDASQ